MKLGGFIVDNKQIFVDEEGNKHEFEIVDVFEVENKDYAVLQEKGQEEAIILKIEYDKEDNKTLKTIEDDNEFMEIRDLYYQLLDDE
ncbi:MAG: DUF1292 domain-containing protein [Firmicutes bacterium]|nr:DUF1292 domain-containing protein [Bacillota bacterium]